MWEKSLRRIGSLSEHAEKGATHADNSYEETRFKKRKKMATIRYRGSRVCKGLFSSDECDLEMFPSEPPQDMTSLTFGIDMVLHIPDGAEGFL